MIGARLLRQNEKLAAVGPRQALLMIIMIVIVMIIMVLIVIVMIIIVIVIIMMIMIMIIARMTNWLPWGRIKHMRTPGPHNKNPRHKIFAKGWVAQNNVFDRYLDGCARTFQDFPRVLSEKIGIF